MPTTGVGVMTFVEACPAVRDQQVQEVADLRLQFDKLADKYVTIQTFEKIGLRNPATDVQGIYAVLAARLDTLQAQVNTLLVNGSVGVDLPAQVVQRMNVT